VVGSLTTLDTTTEHHFFTSTREAFHDILEAAPGGKERLEAVTGNIMRAYRDGHNEGGELVLDAIYVVFMMVDHALGWGKREWR
jgi:hypothetical protein